jgi:hypothetical protein
MEITEELIEHLYREVVFDPDTYGNCVYAAAALFEALKNYGPELELLIGGRTEDGEELDCLIHAVVAVNINGVRHQIDPTEDFLTEEGSGILNTWENCFLYNPENDEPHIDDTHRFKEVDDDFWGLCEECGSPRNDELVANYRQSIQVALACAEQVN